MKKPQLLEIIKNKQPSIFYFHADWCQKCKLIKPLLPKISESKNMTLYEIESNDENEEISNLFDVEYLPTLVVLTETGYKKYVGVLSINKLII